MCKDGGGIVVGFMDFSKRFGVFLNIWGGGDRGDGLKWEDMEIGLIKVLVGEVVIDSFVKKEYVYVF